MPALGALSALALSGVSALLAVPSVVVCVESLCSLLPARGAGKPPRPAELRMAILVPAHDEEAAIADTVRALRSELSGRDRLVVVADNCTDRTALFAREAGAEVVERSDPERRGKGYALSFGAKALAGDPPDVVVVMDADCRVERGSLRELAAAALRTLRPAQAVYLMHAVEGSAASRVSAFAFLVRNLVRPTGLARLGLPCQLTGSGMAFPWEPFRDAPATEGFLVEDLLLGHEFALRGRAPLLCDLVQIGSDLPTSESAGFRQRRRWEHGELTLLFAIAPRLIGKGLLRRELSLVALGLDAAVPPLAFLVLVQGAVVAAGSLVVLFGGSWVPVTIAAGTSTLLGMGLAAAWLAHGRDILPLRKLFGIPAYVLWKVPIYMTFLRKGAHHEWERTER